MRSGSVTGDGSGVCQLANQRRLGIQVEAGLKETGAKTEGEHRPAAPDRMRQLMCF